MKKSCWWVNYNSVIIRNQIIILHQNQSSVTLANYATWKKLIDAAGVDTSNLAAKTDFIAFKVDIPTSFNKLKTKVDDLNVDKFKTVPIDLKKLSDAEDKKVSKNTRFNKLNTQVNCKEKRIPDASSLIQTNQYSTDKHSVEKKH